MASSAGLDAPPGLRPATRNWFRARFGRPTPVQASAWPAIAEGGHVLISAPTGSGKSLAAWLPLIDAVSGQRSSGRGVRALYISPLRALSRDMAAGLVDCLAGLADFAPEGATDRLRIGLRTGDTPASERARQRRDPPEILMTTPESLYVLLGSAGGRELLGRVTHVLIDEIHALVGDKRGAHLALSLERLQERLSWPLQRVGLTATARPLRLVAGFLAGSGRGCRIVSAPPADAPEVRLECPEFPIGAFTGAAHWGFIVERLAELAARPGSMLVFCNTRAMVERVTAAIGEAIGAGQVAAHHGSLGRQRRQRVESALKQGELRLVVSSASLELGIDIGELDRVCQLGSVRGFNIFRQRAGRARHRPGAKPCIYHFPLTRSDLLEARSLLAGLEQSGLDAARMADCPLDVLAQQVTAMVASGLADVDTLATIIRRAAPFRHLDRSTFEAIVDMLHDGYIPGRETGKGPLRRAGGGRLEAGEQTALRCLLNAGTIPEWFEYEVVSTDPPRSLGKLDEEFAFESTPGQILQLGGQSWRIQRIRAGRVEVEASDEGLPGLPFWFGDGAGRSPALSLQIRRQLDTVEKGASCGDAGLDASLGLSRQRLGQLPGPGRIVIERFFDPAGDEHLVIHSFLGARINRAWGLALRKRFCRNFNFELQAAATDDGVLISLGAVHSFELSEVVGYLRSDSIESILTQAVLDTPVFQTRLRWCASTALAIERRTRRGTVPAQVQRNQTENFIARVFPDQLACLENLSGPREVPDHPLVHQALNDCLDDYMDSAGLVRTYRHIEAGRIAVHCQDTREPSALAEALIDAPRNSYLDPAAAEERRTRTFEQPRKAPLNSAPRPAPRPSGESFETNLLAAGYLLAREGEQAGLAAAFMALVRSGGAVNFRPDSRRQLWAHVERLSELIALWPRGEIKPFLSAGLRPAALADRDEAGCRLLLGRVRRLESVTLHQLASETGLEPGFIEQVLLRLQGEGSVMRVGRESAEAVWCPRTPGLRDTSVGADRQAAR